MLVNLIGMSNLYVVSCFLLGEWWNGEMHGQGREIRPNGTLRHDGAWSKGQPMRKRK